MNQNINHKLFVRLLLAWIILSILIGAAVFFLEARTIDAYVVTLATEESSGFIREDRDDLNSPDPARRERLYRKSRKHIEAGHFIAVKLYNSDKAMIVEASHPDARSIQDTIDRHRRDMALTDAVHYRKFYGDGGQIYVLIVMPLRTADRETEGYFEGVYKVAAQTMEELKNRIFLSLLQVVVIIFFTTLAIYPIVLLLNRGLIRRTRELALANIGMLKVLGSAIAKRDSDTNLHNYRVTIYAARLAEALGLKREYVAGLIKGSFLHDVGKIAISDRILLKPGQLIDEERETMKTHVHHGSDIVGHYDWLNDAADVVRYHHEKFDGTGYQAGLRGRDIPINARIFSLADVFDALTSQRPYKEPFPLEKAVQITKEGRGSFFDPALVDTFVKIAGPLHAEIGKADAASLESKLDSLIDRHFSTDLGQSVRVNCWEFMQCGREVGGVKTEELGVCPAYPDHGRDCARVAGTLCGGEIQGTFARKFRNCRKCRFYKSRHYDGIFRRP
jgi:HD-GYP domain-containing protein (c-di-GMP phosphodiesterase class II)